jgi:hypothetical protein
MWMSYVKSGLLQYEDLAGIGENQHRAQISSASFGSKR